MDKKKLSIQFLAGRYAICRLSSNDSIPNWIDLQHFYSITKTDDELSIVCSEYGIPDSVIAEKDWKILKIIGPLDFSLVGILSKISTLLADSKISIFSISTYDTDYILIKTTDVDNTINILNNANYTVKK